MIDDEGMRSLRKEGNTCVEEGSLMKEIGRVGATSVIVSHAIDSPPHVVSVGGFCALDARQARALASLLRSAASELDRIERRAERVP